MQDQTLLFYTLLATGASFVFMSILLLRSTLKNYKLYNDLKDITNDLNDYRYIVYKYDEIMDLYIQKESFMTGIIDSIYIDGYSREKQMEDIAMNTYLAEKIIDIYQEISVTKTPKNQLKQS